MITYSQWQQDDKTTDIFSCCFASVKEIKLKNLPVLTQFLPVLTQFFSWFSPFFPFIQKIKIFVPQ